MTGYEANAYRAGVGRVAVGRGRGGSRCGYRSSPSRSGAAVVAGLSPRPPGRPLSLVPRRSPGANRQPAGRPGSLGCECVPHLLVRRRRRQRRPHHLGGRRAATAAPTVNGALLRPRDAHKLSYRDPPINRSSRFTGLPTPIRIRRSRWPSGPAAGTRWPSSCRPASAAWRSTAGTGSRCAG